jgi:hypothetical protein
MATGKDKASGKERSNGAAKASKPAVRNDQPQKPVAKTASPRSFKTAPDAPSTQSGDGKMRGNTSAKLSPEEVYRLIQESAYFKAKERGFAPGHEVQDWIEAEAEVRRRLEGRA